MTKVCPVCESELTAESDTCPYCGFKLVEATQEFSPIVLEDSDLPTSPATEDGAQAVLEVLRGPQTGLVFTLGNEEATIGRSPDNDIFLNDMTVSRSHANITPSGKSYSITDNNSYNGVWVNNNNVTKTVLRDGDIIQLGAFSLLFKQH